MQQTHSTSRLVPSWSDKGTMQCTGRSCAEVAYRAQQLLEHSLLSELRAIVARALSGLDMFAGGQLSELDLLGSDYLEAPPPAQVLQMIGNSCPVVVWQKPECKWGITSVVAQPQQDRPVFKSRNFPS